MIYSRKIACFRGAISVIKHTNFVSEKTENAECNAEM